MRSRRDHIPCREQNLDERMREGGSLAAGLAGRCEVHKDGVPYRRYLNTDGTFDMAKQWMGNMAWFSVDRDD